MKKVIIPLLISLFIFLIPNYALNPEIIVTPEKCLVNNSVYVIFQWRAPYNVEDFNVTVLSDAVVFKNSTLYYAGVAEDAKVFHIFEGEAVTPGNHTINVQMSYIIDGTLIKKKFLLNISILTLPENIYVSYNNTYNRDEENTSLLENITKIFENTTNVTTPNSTNAIINETNITQNKTNISKNIDIGNITKANTTSQEKITQKFNNTSTQTIENVQKDKGNNWLMYGILGLIIGIVFGFVVMYIIKI
ncbi:hypothetical protein [Methanocaldococcus jannaschii]|nr:hypothetical protein [Methanocaldococcus jannaschii]